MLFVVHNSITKTKGIEKRRKLITSNAYLKTCPALSRRNDVYKLSANYLFRICILFISHSPISLITRLLNDSNQPRIRISCPHLSLITLCRDYQSSNNQLIINS